MQEKLEKSCFLFMDRTIHAGIDQQNANLIDRPYLLKSLQNE